MEEDAGEGRPFLSALIVSTLEPGIPAHWFFRKASELGIYSGDAGNVEAFAFHAKEFYRAIQYYADAVPSPDREATRSRNLREGGCDA